MGILLGCFLVPFIFSLIHRRILQKEGYRLVNLSVLGAAIPFLLIDIMAVEWGWWKFNGGLVVGWNFLNLPVEELLFFTLIPQSCLLLWVGMKKYNKWREIKEDWEKHDWVKKIGGGK